MKNYDLEERTAIFSLNIIDICNKIRKNDINRPLISQLIRSATSIGANYREANGASSVKDFKNKIYICKKEAKESTYWLMLLKNNNPKQSGHLATLEDEAQQLVLIFSKITSTISKKSV
ncbi:four helix bundle protein [Patescibacteria group bacterium]|nr:four helix bundle protein [Patescibacteria group bacterium]